MNERIRKLLLQVDKPARYCGGEFNTPVIKEDAELNFLMCFPDVYEVAHSNLGIKILYYMLNERPDTACESCYAPWTDMGSKLKEENIPLFSLENNRPMNSFDIVGFSMQYEMSYTNLLYMLELGQIPLKAADRAQNCPIIVAGGPCVINPMPLTPFVDIFSIGDGENALSELCDSFVKNKRAGGSRSDFLRAAAKIDGMFVPSVKQGKVRRAVIDSLDSAFYPTKIQIPNIEAVHNRAVLELFRGCTRGCRFCQAGMIYRPVRERTPQTLVKYARELIKNNGFSEISFSSLSTCDYPYLRELLQKVKPYTDEARVSVSLPSTRVDSFEAEFTSSSRLGSLTFAPEAGTQRLRDVINKNVTEEDIFKSMTYAFQRGYSSVKLYFMLGLPTETDEDILGIIDIAKKVKSCYRQNAVARKPLSLSVSTSTFVPKPFTPFQWEAQISLEEIGRRQNLLKSDLRRLGVKYNWHDAKTSRIETVLARGDERAGEAIFQAYKSGCIFDSWNEFFDYDKWVKAFDSAGVDAEKYVKEQPLDEPLCWERIDSGISREYLLAERRRAYEGVLTPDCRNGCRNCGINKAYPSAFKSNCLNSCKGARTE